MRIRQNNVHMYLAEVRVYEQGSEVVAYESKAPTATSNRECTMPTQCKVRGRGKGIVVVCGVAIVVVVCGTVCCYAHSTDSLCASLSLSLSSLSRSFSRTLSLCCKVVPEEFEATPPERTSNRVCTPSLQVRRPYKLYSVKLSVGGPQCSSVQLWLSAAPCSSL